MLHIDIDINIDIDKDMDMKMDMDMDMDIDISNSRCFSIFYGVTEPRVGVRDNNKYLTGGENTCPEGGTRWKNGRNVFYFLYEMSCRNSRNSTSF